MGVVGVYMEQIQGSKFVRVTVPDADQRAQVMDTLLGSARSGWDVRPDTSGRIVAFKVAETLLKEVGLLDPPKPRRGRPRKHTSADNPRPS